MGASRTVMVQLMSSGCGITEPLISSRPLPGKPAPTESLAGPTAGQVTPSSETATSLRASVAAGDTISSTKVSVPLLSASFSRRNLNAGAAPDSDAAGGGAAFAAGLATTGGALPAAVCGA